MNSIGKIFKLVFLGLLFIVLSVGYKLFGNNDHDDDDASLFDIKNANADVGGSCSSCSSCDSDCGGSDS
ncbi:MAG: hypothetical protein A3D65_00740 [Candidatus Lloydbacteria bacterium RIFCSPHIGHO2_02_FULL_50_13]|uniref:Uncharacterized protein n=1 Tax=Candidatus Lloydbacteria bacterium RIFCSPHIGHO2_02_FULL_50_13 TaxID=1798661 RepID=A0A1G2D0Q9_9BACT|nr:MAG: hypothetical protein A3D65_00740 [Candidatus Lloydbacteria bacterium RIFCSPHIGHO2_02_FULL_50_13]